MTLIDEYLNQNARRNWPAHLSLIPIQNEQVVLDLGSSIGWVSELLAEKSKNVIGIDINRELLDYAKNHSKGNIEFVYADLNNISFSQFRPFDGVWMSFALAYIGDPDHFISKIAENINPNGWVAIMDISCFLSGNMNPNSMYFKKVIQFEEESYKNGVYDFNIGSKIKKLLAENGFDIIYHDDDVYDAELNFNHKAKEAILFNWKARLNRMVKLKEYLGETYEDFSREFINYISTDEHTMNKNVRYVVGRKA